MTPASGKAAIRGVVGKQCSPCWVPIPESHSGTFWTYLAKHLCPLRTTAAADRTHNRDGSRIDSQCITLNCNVCCCDAMLEPMGELLQFNTIGKTMSALAESSGGRPHCHKEMLHAWLGTLDSSETRRSYRAAVTLAFRTMNWNLLEQVTADDLAHFKKSLANKAPATVAQRLAALRSFFRYAVETGRLRVDPTTALKMPRVNPSAPRALTIKQAKRIVEQIDATKPTGKRDAAAVALLFGGLRLSEAVGLNIGDVNLEAQDGHTFTRVHVVGKGAKPREVDLPVRAYELVQAWLEMRPGPRDEKAALFVGNVTGYRTEPGRLTADGLYRQFRRYAKRAKVKVSGSHAARHTWAKLAEQSGARMVDIMNHLGHANLSVTATYLKRLAGRRNPASDSVPVLG